MFESYLGSIPERSDNPFNTDINLGGCKCNYIYNRNSSENKAEQPTEHHCSLLLFASNNEPLKCVTVQEEGRGQSRTAMWVDRPVAVRFGPSSFRVKGRGTWEGGIRIHND